MSAQQSEYPWIELWPGAFESYRGEASWVVGTVDEARESNAPQRAVYYNEQTEKWVTVDEIGARNPELQESIREVARRHSLPEPTFT